MKKPELASAPTVYDVAERAGVSIATVSFTFRKPERVRDSTREAVLAAARALGYLPSASARWLAQGRTGALGLYSFDYLRDVPDPPHGAGCSPTETGADGAAVCNDPNEDLRVFPLYVDEAQRGFELECWRRGYALMIGGGSHSNSEPVVTDIAGRVDGLAVFPVTVPDDVLRLISRRIPVVELAEPSREHELNHVAVDNVGATRALTEHLITDHGLRELLFVGAPVTSDNEARFKGFRMALRAAGLRVPRKPVALQDSTKQSAAVAMRSLMARGALPEGLVCATDVEALVVMDALAEAGVLVPDEVAVTGFDGIAAGRIARPTLTTVRQPMEHVGRTAVDILIERLKSPTEPPVTRRLPVRMVLRESCGCPPR